MPLAFTFAYALTRSAMPWKGAFRLVALTPILAPSMLAAISFVQWFGNQGALKALMFGHQVYGPIGIIISSVYAIFPHALMIVVTSLLLTDRRLYEAAESLGTTRRRQFFTITLPAARYGLVSAAMVVFSYTVSDFGIPKVIGGNFHVLAIDIYQQVIGQQNFNRGAVVGLILLLPVVVAFAVDWWMQGRQHAQFSARAVPYVARRAPAFDAAMFAFCALCAPVDAVGARHGGLHVADQAVAVRSVDQPAPLCLRADRRRPDRLGFNKCGALALRSSAVGPTASIFGAAYLLEKTKGLPWAPARRSGCLRRFRWRCPAWSSAWATSSSSTTRATRCTCSTAAWRSSCCPLMIHYYTSSHLAAVTALKSLDGEFEAVSASLKVPFWKTFHPRDRAGVPAGDSRHRRAICSSTRW